jgi:hypothetical protein
MGMSHDLRRPSRRARPSCGWARPSSARGDVERERARTISAHGAGGRGARRPRRPGRPLRRPGGAGGPGAGRGLQRGHLAQRPHRPRRDPGHPRRLRAARQLPAHRLRRLRQLRAVPHVPGRAVLGPPPRRLLRRHPQGGSGRRLRRRHHLRGARPAAGVATLRIEHLAFEAEPPPFDVWRGLPGGSATEARDGRRSARLPPGEPARAACPSTSRASRCAAFAGEPVAVALFAAGVRTLGRSPKYHRPRGLFCLEGHCASCFLRIDGRPNARSCLVPAREGCAASARTPSPTPTSISCARPTGCSPRGWTTTA